MKTVWLPDGTVAVLSMPEPLKSRKAHELDSICEYTDLEGADDARHDAEHAGVGAPRAALRPRRLRKEAPVAGTCMGTRSYEHMSRHCKAGDRQRSCARCSVLMSPRSCSTRSS